MLENELIVIANINVEDSSDEKSDEKSDKIDEAIESAVNYFTECSDLRENFALLKQGENRYLRGLYEQQARGKDYYFSVLCESSLSTRAESKNDASTKFDLI